MRSRGAGTVCAHVCFPISNTGKQIKFPFQLHSALDSDKLLIDAGNYTPQCSITVNEHKVVREWRSNKIKQNKFFSMY